MPGIDDGLIIKIRRGKIMDAFGFCRCSRSQKCFSSICYGEGAKGECFSFESVCRQCRDVMPVGDLFRAGADRIAEMLVRFILPILVSKNLHGQ